MNARHCLKEVANNNRYNISYKCNYAVDKRKIVCPTSIVSF